jgi:hypothetical protein
MVKIPSHATVPLTLAKSISQISYYDLYVPVRNGFDAGNIRYKGKWEEVERWKSRLFWAL